MRCRPALNFGTASFAALALAASAILLSCPAREAGGKGTQVPSAELSPEAKGPDPRAAFESSGMLGGLSAAAEYPATLITGFGSAEAGVALSLGAQLSTAAVARRTAPPSPGAVPAHELALASGARALLPGPALALAASGDWIVASCADPKGSGKGILIGYKAEGGGQGLAEAWRTASAPAIRLLAVPGGRLLMADEGGELSLIEASTGARAWGKRMSEPVSDIAYAPGLVLAASGRSLEAFDESTAALAWSSALRDRAAFISAGNGTALVLAMDGSLSSFTLAEGKETGSSAGPFDPYLRPIADGGFAIVALQGGATELDVKTGLSLRSWSWEGRTAFIAADKDRLYAGIDGREGRGLLIASRTGDAAKRLARLNSAPFDEPLAVTGARGGLLLLLMDGSLVLVGREAAAEARPSAIDAAIAPPQSTASAISSAVGRFRSADAAAASGYLRFDLFAQGIPVDPGVSFTAFRFDSAASSKRSFFAKPAGPGTVVAIYDAAGRELTASIDELGSTSRTTAYFEKGKSYWIVAGWLEQAEPSGFRLYAK
jgi:hypothetical protein